MPSLVVGIDPGVHTGIAHFVDGRLTLLATITPDKLERYIGTLMPDRVIFEDSRLESKVWTSARGAAALKIARNVGEIDAWCRLITAICETLAIPAHGVSPKAKGSKTNAAQFARFTGWQASSNQHGRDAACVAWKYRGASP